jgi:hypothetical protein
MPNDVIPGGGPAMTLTEEQLAALKRVVAYMDEMYAVASPYHGCTEDANRLRAMIDSSDHIVEPDELIGFDLEVRWHDDYMKRFSDITTWHCGHATLWIMHSSGKQEWIPLASVRRISSVEKSP